MYVCCSVTDIVLDMAILCIPTTFIRTLHMSRGQKVGLIGIFGLGVLYVPVPNSSLLLPCSETEHQLHNRFDCTSSICSQIRASQY